VTLNEVIVERVEAHPGFHVVQRTSKLSILEASDHPLHVDFEVVTVHFKSSERHISGYHAARPSRQASPHTSLSAARGSAQHEGIPMPDK
jgi:hypothetical protein